MPPRPGRCGGSRHTDAPSRIVCVTTPKGHAGAAVLPAALAFLDGPAAATTHDLVAALAVGYEISLRAGLVLHGTASDYHSSGAWNALGAAAVGARLLGLDATATWHALGIAEYSAPRAPMMRAIAHPTMVKDSSAWALKLELPRPCWPPTASPAPPQS
jgi:2-methylcitrate dehydratase PrpD